MPRPWSASILTLYPEMFPGPLAVSLTGKALSDGLWQLDVTDIRNFAQGKHRQVDDTPAGGGAGMVMRADIAAAAIDDVRAQHPDLPAIYLTPRGKPLDQARIRTLSEGPGAIVLCGRFEGLDQRVIDSRGLEEASLGDFVLSGGEIAAMALIEATVRLLPGVIGQSQSLDEESFEHDLLEYPHYTRPREWEGRAIPEVLLSGDHGAIARWRREQAEAITRERRADLWARRKRS